MASSPYRFYLDILSNWSSTIALESQWFMYFNLPSVNALKGDVGSAVRNYDSGNSSAWSIGSGIVSQLTKTEYQLTTESLIGCVFARQITLPGETIGTSNEGVDYAGYLGPATSSNRDVYKKLSIVFTETNASFIDLILRPWSILVGYNGLIARQPGSPKNVKCDYADIVFLAKTGANSPMAKRKIFRFYNIVPSIVPGMSQTYASEGMIYGAVDFAYDYYSVLEADSPTLANQ
jgi:hypothetical protein